MNKVGLSLSVLSLCWFISIDGWAGEFFSNNSLCCLSKKATPSNAPTQNSPPTIIIQAPVPTMQPTAPLPQPIPAATCGQKTTITDSNGQVTTIETTCDRRINY
jgi:hypothetical protein